MQVSIFSIIDLYIHEDCPIVIDSPNFIKRQCDFFQLYEYPQDLMNGLTSVLICLYINLISEDIANFNISISEECGIINAIYNQAALLMYTFNAVFFSLKCLILLCGKIMEHNVLLSKINIFQKKN